VSDISGDKLRILRKVKSESWRHADHAVTASNRLVACAIGRMNDQQSTEPREPFIHGANHGSIQRCDSIRLVPAICRDQNQTGACVHAPCHCLRGGGPAGRHRVTHAAVVFA
jgi:hypothetical protein